MSTPIDFATDAAAPNPVRAISRRTLWLWSVRRELWENRSIVIGPLVVAVLALVGFAIRAFHIAELQRSGADASGIGSLLEAPAQLIAVLMIATTTLIGVFYCADALHTERSDRSILFWKSLPVSDWTTVLSKASIPVVVLPLLSYVVIVVSQLLMLAGTALIVDTTEAGSPLPLFGLMVDVLSVTVVHVLWFAPVSAWLLFVSGWARRMVIVTAALPWLLAALVERIAFGTTWIGHLLKERLFGAGPHGLDFGRFGSGQSGTAWTSPSLWLGVAVAAALLSAAVQMRRRSAPL